MSSVRSTPLESRIRFNGLGSYASMHTAKQPETDDHVERTTLHNKNSIKEISILELIV